MNDENKRSIMIKSIALFYIFISGCISFSVFAKNFEPVEYTGATTKEWVSDLANEMFNSSNRVTSDKDNLILLENNLQSRIKSDSNNPALYFLLGRVKYGFLSKRADEIKHLAREELLKDEPSERELTKNEIRVLTRKMILNDKEWNRLKNEVTEFYEKALELDDKGYQIQLTGEMLGIIDASIFSNSDMRVKALRKELNRPWGESESFEYNTYSRIVTAYIDEKRYDEALSVINEIEEKFPSMQTEIESGRQRIWGFQQAAQAAQAEQEKTPQPTELKKPESAIAKPQQQLVQQQPPAKEKDTPQKPKATREADNNQVIIIGIVLFVLMLVGFMVARRKPK